MYLSKTSYVQVWSCPKNAWLNRYRKDLVPDDANSQARKKTGNEVGDLARGLFGPFINVTGQDNEGKLDKSSMIEKTCLEMKKGTPVICEAAFSYNGLYCAVDLLRKDGNGWAIYEVKSSSDGEQDKYIADVSYQKYVLEHCGIKVTKVYLVCIDTDYVLGPEGLDLNGFFKINDLSERADKEQTTVIDILRIAETILESETEPYVELDEKCKECDFYKYCKSSLPEPNVFDLYRLPMKKKIEYYRHGLISFTDLEASGVITNDKQLRQMDYALRERQTYTDTKQIKKFLAGLSYPLYFLDFETMQPAIPFCVGTHPYAQIPFQYSLHIKESENGALQHKEFLAISGMDPRRDIAEALCRDIPVNVCVTAYNKSFECARIKELAEAFPDLSKHLLAIEKNIVDLLDPFQKGWYYKREIGGSFSIKSVLPAICPNDPELDYHALEDVHNGSEAMSVFPEIQYMQPEEQKKARKNLLAYCRLDTLAMVKVWEELCKVSDK